MTYRTVRSTGAPSGAAPALLASPSFRALWISVCLISLAVQFYFVGLVWLVLDVTGSGLALGTVLAVAAVPRAAAMLLSGALIDRRPGRLLLTVSSLTSAALVGLIAGLLGLGDLGLGQVLVLVSLLGLMDAIFYPVASALVARLVDRSRLASANALVQGADTVANIVGPVLSGFVVGAFGLEAAFWLNAALFIAGCLVVRLMRREAEATAPAPERESYGRALVDGVRYAWRTPVVRVSLIVIALLNFGTIGPMIVGTAILAETRFGGDATLYGLLFSVYGGGALVGTVAAGAVGRLRRPGLLLAWLSFGIGFGMIAIGLAPTAWLAAVAIGLMGILGGFVIVFATAWLQAHTDDRMQGRVASLLAFAAVAVDPFSQAASGALVELGVTTLFVAAGTLMLATGALMLPSRALRQGM